MFIFPTIFNLLFSYIVSPNRVNAQLFQNLLFLLFQELFIEGVNLPLVDLLR